MRDEYKVCEDFRSKKFWRACFAEGIGVAIVVFIGCGSMLVGNYDSYPHYEPMDEPQKAKLFMSPKVIRVSFAFGFAVATATWNLFHASGAHFNPAITLAMLAAGRITLVRGFVYILGQLVGSLVGAGVLRLCIPDDYRDKMGASVLAADLDPGRGALIELAITFIVVFTYFASVDKYRTDLNGSVPLSIGVAVFICHLAAFPITNSSLNPARSFGPAVLANFWEHHWVFWVGPFVGALCAGLLYKIVFTAEPIRRDYTTTTECPLIITTAPDDMPRQDPFASPTTNFAVIANEPAQQQEEREGLLSGRPSSTQETGGLQMTHMATEQETTANVAEVSTSQRPATPPPATSSGSPAKTTSSPSAIIIANNFQRSSRSLDGETVTNNNSNNNNSVAETSLTSAAATTAALASRSDTKPTAIAAVSLCHIVTPPPSSSGHQTVNGVTSEVD